MAKLGRPYKGQRDALLIRTSVPLGAAVRASAVREGYQYLSDYVASILAEHEGVSAEVADVRAPVRAREEASA
jgi:hypothetical protein